MATHSPARASVPTLEGLKLIHRGKVRDTYEINNDHLLVVATDGISIFDFVLNAVVPQKGYILNAMSHFWFTCLEDNFVKTHMNAAGQGIDPFLPMHLGNNVDLQCRAMVVRKLTMLEPGAPIEFVGRNCLTGSVLGEYRERGSVYGVKLPKGLQDGDILSKVLFTPTTKADEGHDEPLDPKVVYARNKNATSLFLRAFKEVSRRARTRNILLADTKGELGIDTCGGLMLGDEFGTPDSSRFWDLLEWKRSRKEKVRKAPPPFDKQLVRAWGIEHSINKLKPENPEHVACVHRLKVPAALIEATTSTYRYIFWRLTGLTFEQYAQLKLGVELSLPMRKLAIIFGSRSDISREIVEALGKPDLKSGIREISVNVISCHRNPDDLVAFAASGCGGADVVIAAGGKAFALPGVLDALLHAEGKWVPVIGVALAESGSRSEQAARLSIEELPGQPVVIDESGGSAYIGIDGFERALQRVAHGELPPPKMRVPKPAELNIQLSTL